MKRILLVDIDKDFRNAFKTCVSEEKLLVEVIDAESVEQGIKIFSESSGKFSAVMVDGRSSEGWGVTLVREIQKSYPAQIIAISGHPTAKIEMKKAGCVSFPKPFTPGKLVNLINNLPEA